MSRPVPATHIGGRSLCRGTPAQLPARAGLEATIRLSGDSLHYGLGDVEGVHKQPVSRHFPQCCRDCCRSPLTRGRGLRVEAGGCREGPSTLLNPAWGLRIRRRVEAGGIVGKRRPHDRRRAVGVTLERMAIGAQHQGGVGLVSPVAQQLGHSVDAEPGNAWGPAQPQRGRGVPWSWRR